MGDEFFRTGMGRKFYGGTMERIADALEAIAKMSARVAVDAERRAAAMGPPPTVWRSGPGEWPTRTERKALEHKLETAYGWAATNGVALVRFEHVELGFLLGLM